MKNRLIKLKKCWLDKKTNQKVYQDENGVFRFMESGIRVFPKSDKSKFVKIVTC